MDGVGPTPQNVMRSIPSATRPQVTAHIDADTREWLGRYAKKLKLNPSELVRLLIQRERRTRWIEKSLSLSDEDLAALSIRRSAASIQTRKAKTRRPSS